MIKYLVIPDTVRSKNDGDEHYITASQLIKLYNVNPIECKTVTNLDYLRGVDLSKFTILKPRYDGNYELPITSKGK